MRKTLSCLLFVLLAIACVAQTPTITSVTPEPVLYNNQITIHGSGFGATQGSGVAYVTSSSTLIPAQVISWADDTVVVLPSAANGGGACHVVINQNGINSNYAWVHILTPEIDSISPPSAPLGAQITLTGLRFGTNQSTGAVDLCYRGTCTALLVSNWTDTQIVATIPPGAHSGILQVWQSGMVSSNWPSFTILDSPTIFSISPEPAMYGTAITIHGSGFGATQGTAGDVLIYPGPTHPAILSWSNTDITFQHSGANGAGALLAEVDQAGIASNQLYFHVLQPEIDNVSPGTAALGGQVTLTGLRFGTAQGTGYLEICAPDACTPLVISGWGDTQVTATIPAGAHSGTLRLWQQGVCSNWVNFIVIDAPTITATSPEPATYGADITIHGTGFGATQGNGLAYLYYSATPALAQVVSWSDSAVVVRHSFPVNGGGAMSVMIQQNGIASNFTWSHANPPLVTSITPSSGPIGTEIIINGSNFGPTAPVSGVITLGGTILPIVSWSNTAIHATVIDGSASGTVSISLGGYSLPAGSFSILNPIPQITGISPSNGPIGTTITISGTDFGTQPSAPMIGNVALTNVNWSDTSVTATIPNDAKTGYIWFQSGENMVSGGRFIITGRSQVPDVTLTPSDLSMVVGDTHTLDALDADGNPVLGLLWNSSNINVISLSQDDPPVLTALNAGQSTITAGSSTAVVTVYLGPELPDGTTEWSIPTADANGAERMIPAIRTIGLTPAYLAVATVADGSKILRGISDEGRQLWATKIGSDPNSGSADPVRAVVPENSGGSVNLIGFPGPANSGASSLVRVDGKSGLQAWRYNSPGVISPGLIRQNWGQQYLFSGVTVHPDGRTFAFEQLPGREFADHIEDSRSRLIALKASSSGATPSATWDLPSSTETTYYTCQGLDMGDPQITTSAPQLGPPTVMPDGSVSALILTWNDVSTWDYCTETSSSEGHSELDLISVNIDLKTTKICQDSCGQVLREVIPDGSGGAIAAWDDPSPSNPNQTVGKLATISKGSVKIYSTPFRDWVGPLLLGENGAIVSPVQTVDNGGSIDKPMADDVYAINSGNGQTIWNAGFAFEPAELLAGGGVEGLTFRLDSNGNVVPGESLLPTNSNLISPLLGQQNQIIGRQNGKPSSARVTQKPTAPTNVPKPDLAKAATPGLKLVGFEDCTTAVTQPSGAKTYTRFPKYQLETASNASPLEHYTVFEQLDENHKDFARCTKDGKPTGVSPCNYADGSIELPFNRFLDKLEIGFTKTPDEGIFIRQEFNYGVPNQRLWKVNLIERYGRKLDYSGYGQAATDHGSYLQLRHKQFAESLIDGQPAPWVGPCQGQYPWVK